MLPFSFGFSMHHMNCTLVLITHGILCPKDEVPWYIGLGTQVTTRFSELVHHKGQCCQYLESKKGKNITSSSLSWHIEKGFMISAQYGCFKLTMGSIIKFHSCGSSIAFNTSNPDDPSVLHYRDSEEPFQTNPPRSGVI